MVKILAAVLFLSCGFSAYAIESGQTPIFLRHISPFIDQYRKGIETTSNEVSTLKVFDDLINRLRNGEDPETALRPVNGEPLAISSFKHCLAFYLLEKPNAISETNVIPLTVQTRDIESGKIVLDDLNEPSLVRGGLLARMAFITLYGTNLNRPDTLSSDAVFSTTLLNQQLNDFLINNNAFSLLDAAMMSRISLASVSATKLVEYARTNKLLAKRDLDDLEVLSAAVNQTFSSLIDRSWSERPDLLALALAPLFKQCKLASQLLVRTALKDPNHLVPYFNESGSTLSLLINEINQTEISVKNATNSKHYDSEMSSTSFTEASLKVIAPDLHNYMRHISEGKNPDSVGTAATLLHQLLPLLVHYNKNTTDDAPFSKDVSDILIEIKSITGLLPLSN